MVGTKTKIETVKLTVFLDFSIYFREFVRYVCVMSVYGVG